MLNVEEKGARGAETHEAQGETAEDLHHDVRRMKRAVQRRAAARAREPSEAEMQRAAQTGTRGAGGDLPHLAAVQRSFGRHDLSGLKAHTDGAAVRGAEAMNAEAFTSGEHVAFAGAPSLHTAAHEAAHYIQQRNGASPSGAVGREGDDHEKHADAVADRVVAGRSSEALLDRARGAAPSGTARIQRKVTVKAKPLASGDKSVNALTSKQQTALALLQKDMAITYHFPNWTELKAHLDGDKKAKVRLEYHTATKAKEMRAANVKKARGQDKGEDGGDEESEVPRASRGDFTLVRRPSFGRSDSLDNMHRVPGADYHDHMRDANILKYREYTSKKQGPPKVKSKNPNTLAVGMTVAYRRPDGSPGHWQQPIGNLPMPWNSGYEQIDHKGNSDDLCKLFNDHSDELALHGKGLNVPANAAAANANQHAHSETAFAADPERDALFATALGQFAATLPKATKAGPKSGQTVLVSVTLDADSYPNTMCGNACRPAIQLARQALDRVVREFVKTAPAMRLSREYGTDSRTTSATPFMVAGSDPLKAFGKLRADTDAPVVGKGGTAFEVYPDGRTTPGSANREIQPIPPDQIDPARWARLEAAATQAQFWNRLRDRLAGAADAAAQTAIVNKLTTAQMTTLLGSLMEDVQLVLGYPGVLPDEVSKFLIQYLAGVLRKRPDLCKGGKKGGKHDPGGGGFGGGFGGGSWGLTA